MNDYTVNVVFNAPFVLPSGLGQFWRLRWDDEIPPEYAVRPSAYNVNGGTPATRTTLEGLFVDMDAAQQDWRVNVIWRNMAPPEWVRDYDAASDRDKVETMFARKFLGWSHSQLAWFNHDHGSDKRAVYPWGLNLDHADGTPNSPMGQQMLSSAGNVVLQIAPEFESQQKTWIPCKALKPNELPAWSEIRHQPWLLNLCTVQRIELESNNHHRVDPFPHLTTGIVYDVPLVLLSNNGVITFDKNMLEPIAAGTKVPCPYNLSRPFGRALADWN